MLRSSSAGSRPSRTARTTRSRTRPRPRCSWSPSGRRNTRPRRPSTPSSSGAATPSRPWPSSSGTQLLGLRIERYALLNVAVGRRPHRHLPQDHPGLPEAQGGGRRGGPGGGSKAGA
ncbi:MAG: hypothetical protein MZW92_02275 [Comamonadaceae bacterium]|nr:hypothetical protein [Comamonadaceae bacterium]